ncbi:hypothetical protein FA13DRAFT_1621795 [Coprinellus micaceus]|uniref:Uncharacterized protein n=1 Tax=Coprinellus micaceus TaxID=71717 RepID=A0A4Y7TUQ7_COPMI|nr:hypothetical protein FA13DRAFT_1621795 [Coprinellus micaceus]
MLFAKLTLFSTLLTAAHPALSLKESLKNRHNTLVGRTNDRCAPGSYSSTGYSPCTLCPAGTYSKEYQQKSCISCRSGYYCPSPGQTSETACQPGTYSPSAGSSSCSSCPPGYMCPSSSLSNPQQCSPGRYSQGGEKECPRCPAGYFNNIHKATDCCPCPAGWFNANAGNTNCQMCPNQTPYSNPGTASMGQCTSKPGSWTPSKTSSQPSDGSCPPSHPLPSSIPKRHVKPKPKCAKSNEEACPIYSGLQLTGYGCMDVKSNLESCGGCIEYMFDGRPTGGRDCSAIAFANEVGCVKGKCRVGSCRHGFIVSLDAQSCVPSFGINPT